MATTPGAFSHDRRQATIGVINSQATQPLAQGLRDQALDADMAIQYGHESATIETVDYP